MCTREHDCEADRIHDWERASVIKRAANAEALPKYESRRHKKSIDELRLCPAHLEKLAEVAR